MEKGDVMLGGEESGGIGIPSHVMERDGLLMALLLCETMAQRGMSWVSWWTICSRRWASWSSSAKAEDH